MLEEVDDVDWPGGGYSCSREVAHVAWQRGDMAQLELDESLRCGRQPAAVRRRDECTNQYEPGEQRAASRFAVVLRLDHVVHGKRSGSHRKCSARLEYEGVATYFSFTKNMRWIRPMLWEKLETGWMPMRL